MEILNKNTENETKTSLYHYLKEKGVLISSIGAMLGLGGFLGIIGLISAKNLSEWLIIMIYVFIFLLVLGVVIIWSEIIYTFPSHPEIRLKLFKYVLILLYILTTIITCLVYRNLSSIFMPVIIFFMIGLPLLRFLEKTILFKLVEWIKKRYNNKFILVIFGLIIALIITFVLSKFTDYVNSIIDKMLIK